MLRLHGAVVFVCKARLFSFLPRSGISRYSDCAKHVRPDKLTGNLAQAIWERFPRDTGMGGEM